MNSPTAALAHGDRNPWPGAILAGLIVIILVAASVSWGSVDPVSRTALAAVTCAVGAVALAALLWRGESLRLPPGSVPLLAFAGFVFAQAIPFDAGSISQCAAATLSQGRLLLAYVVLFFCGATVLSHPRRMRQLPWALLLLGGAVGTYYGSHPFLEHVPPLVAQDGFVDHVFGTFLNRNHVGALLVASSLVAVGLAVNRRRTLSPRAPGYARRQVYVVVLLIVSAGGLIATRSRGAMVALVAGAACLAILLPRSETRTGRVIPVAGVLGLVALLPFVLPDDLLARFSQVERDLSSAGMRRGLWSSALELFQIAPIVGHGYGSFPAMSVLEQPDEVIGHIEHAHSDPLELLAETGLLGMSLVLWTFGLVAHHIISRCRRTRGDRRRTLAVAAAAACISLSIHACIDFDFHIPALAAWIAVLAGAGSGAMATANGLPLVGRAAPRWLLLSCMVLLGLASLFSGREAWSYAVQLRAGSQPGELIQNLDRASGIHECKGEAHSRSAWMLANADEPHRDYGNVAARARDALRRNQFDARAWHALALARIWTEDRVARSSTGAETAAILDSAVRVAPPSERADRRIELGLALLAARSELARRWFHDLFHDPRVDPVRVLQRLHVEDGDLDVRPLIPQDVRAPLQTYADLLLHGGRLRQRERILDLLLDRLPDRDRQTIRDDVTLSNVRVRESLDEAGRLLHVGIRLDTPRGHVFDSQMMCLLLAGRESSVAHYFRPTSGESLHVVNVPTHVPPGRYELALQAFTNGVRFPIEFVTIPETGLHLTPGRTLAARRALYRSSSNETARPTRIRPNGSALTLTRGVRLWRTLRLGDEGGTLVLSTSEIASDDSAIDVQFNGSPLHSASDRGSTDHRYQLPPSISSGVLSISSDRADPIRVYGITLLSASGS